MTTLITEANLPRPDDFYQVLTDMHRDLTDEQSADVNARLILLLSNHIGDQYVLEEAMTIAREHIS
ncbi:DUF2783 domain-containing protein [Neptunomonas japonica]|uniref:DUF2783 domain-containing protein n=1 Tax=Neptunomonas japonica TaxID=417574 RepID=UPI00040792F3|nr:DUF2783 domain-containing protein [Neptunomonas japonica]